jgi:hypothetical protein
LRRGRDVAGLETEPGTSQRTLARILSPATKNTLTIVNFAPVVERGQLMR